MKECEQQKNGIGGNSCSDSLRGDASGNAPHRAGCADSAVRSPRTCRIESFGNERPESGEKHSAGSGEMQVDRDCDPTAAIEECPFGGMAERAQRKPCSDNRQRRKTVEQPRKDRDECYGRGRGCDHHQGQCSGRPSGQECGVTERLGRNLVRDHDARGRHGDAREVAVHRWSSIAIHHRDAASACLTIIALIRLIHRFRLR